MRIVISSGHGKYVRGASGYLDEVDEARLIVEEVARVLRTVGVETTTFHDNVSTSQNENLNRIVDFHNSKARDYDVSVHLNAYETTSKPMGSEVLYITQQTLAGDVVDAICIASGLINRGPKKRTDLFFLNSTDKPAILVETCFVDSSADASIYNDKFTEICRAIAEGISGETAQPGPGPEPPDPGPEPIPPTPPTDRPMIGKGDSGPAVSGLQRSMGVLEVDGDFGEITRTQVISFQNACGLDADGIVGPVTWGEVDKLDVRVIDSDTGLTDEQVAQVAELARRSPLMNYSWPDRGKTPPGYLPGMALVFAMAILQQDTESIKVMSKADTHNDDIDALSWYRSNFAALGMNNDRNGVETLRHLFVLMIGLGPMESSGRYCEGRDLSASNVQADTAEAGLFQTSWNIASADASIPDLLDVFWDSPVGFLEEFKKGVVATANNLSSYGRGSGAQYQWLSRFAPAFHALVTGVGLRKRRQHWGPINRKEAMLKREADDLLKQVESLMFGAVV